MKPADIDWSVLRRPLVLLALSCVVSAGIVGSALYFVEEVKATHLRESRRLADARSRYLRLDEEKRIIEEYYPRFRALEAAGVIGEERRLDWIDALRSAADALRLPSVQYEISSQQPVEPDFPAPEGRFGLRASDMKLDLGLVHEEDLLRFFRILDARNPGLFSVQGCELRREREEPVYDPERPNLRAVCRLRWYVLQLQEDSGGGAGGGLRRRGRRG